MGERSIARMVEECASESMKRANHPVVSMASGEPEWLIFLEPRGARNPCGFPPTPQVAESAGVDRFGRVRETNFLKISTERCSASSRR